jgi:ketosteroid isomerase-like protein
MIVKHISAAFAAVLLAGSALSAGAFADSADDAQSAMQSVYDAQCAQIKAGDVDSVTKLYADTYTETAPSGKKTSRDEALAMMKTGLAQVKITSCAAKISAVTKDGDNLVVSVEETAEGTLLANDAPVKNVSVQKDTWKKNGNGWQELSSVVSEISLSLNGNLIQHEVAPTPSPSSKP